MNMDEVPTAITVISQKENYSVDAFMEAFSISRNTFYAEVRAERLVVFKYNRRTFVTRADAEAWLKKIKELGAQKRILKSNRFKDNQ